MSVKNDTNAGAGSIPDDFHQAKWPEPPLHAIGDVGVGGFGEPPLSAEEEGAVEGWRGRVDATLRRRQPPANPNLGEPVVLRHFERLSQMVLSPSVASQIGIATCTLKYNPLLGEELGREMREVHPLSDDDTIQGLLSAVWDAGEWLKALSGFDAVSFAPSGGAHGIFTNAKIIAKYHADRGDAGKRDEIITTILSHPADAATPAVAGMRVITLFPEADGLVSLEAMRSAVSERTAGFMVCNPEDTGLYNPHMQEMTRIVREAGGLCASDQANANGTLGLIRPADMGFDLCQYNLHKTFATPHGSLGLACGPVAAREELAYLLPGPIVERTESGEFYRDTDRPDSIGLVRANNGNLHTVVKALAWLERLGIEGVRTASRLAVLNNAYLMAGVLSIAGASVSYAENPARRMEQTRYSWEELHEATGVGTGDMEALIGDYGVQTYWESHSPWLVPEPFSLEPTETVTQGEIDHYVQALRAMAELAREQPEVIHDGPTRGAMGHAGDVLYGETITTWRHQREAAARAEGTSASA